MTPPEAGTGRADRVLAHLMEAFERGELDRVEAFATRLGTDNPGLRVWATYVQAGCKALQGEPAAGLRLIAAADASGGWWSPALLADPALAAIWPLDERGDIRRRSEERWRVASASAEVSWDVLRPASPKAAVISLHGNGPAPADLFRSLWAELEDCAAFLVRSPQLVACNVYEWRDRQRALADVRTVALAARAEVGQEVPLILAGLGAGGRIAIEAALAGEVDAAGAVAFAPHLAPLDDARAGCGTRIWIYPGGSEASVTSCATFAEWARARGFDCTVRHEKGLGHALPERFGPTVAAAISTILSDELPITSR
jgi:predicted esterase